MSVCRIVDAETLDGGRNASRERSGWDVLENNGVRGNHGSFADTNGSDDLRARVHDHISFEVGSAAGVASAAQNHVNADLARIFDDGFPVDHDAEPAVMKEYIAADLGPSRDRRRKYDSRDPVSESRDERESACVTTARKLMKEQNDLHRDPAIEPSGDVRLRAPLRGDVVTAHNFTTARVFSRP